MAEYKSTEKTKTQETPPAPVNPIDVLGNFLRGTKHSVPKMFPTVPARAAQYWIDHQEPANEFTERLIPIKINNEITGWQTPYHNRLVSSLRKFLTLKPIHQTFVIEKIEFGIPWRGDDIQMFTEIVKEAEKMAQNKPAYIQNALSILKSFRFGSAA